MAQKDVLGRAGEAHAEQWMRELGWRIADRNWRCAEGELDIVAIHWRWVVVVEVKTRRGIGYGHPFEAITARKLARLHRLARAWMRAHPDIARGRTVRVDGIAITGEGPDAVLEHLRDLR